MTKTSLPILISLSVGESCTVCWCSVSEDLKLFLTIFFWTHNLSLLGGLCFRYWLSCLDLTWGFCCSYCSGQIRSVAWTGYCCVCWHAYPASSPWIYPSCWSPVAGTARNPQCLTLENGSCKGGWDLQVDLSSFMMRLNFNLFYELNFIYKRMWDFLFHCEWWQMWG